MSTLEVKVPDIGDYRDVPITEVLVKPGDSVAAEDPLITLESDKAALDIPAPAAGGARAPGAPGSGTQPRAAATGRAAHGAGADRGVGARRRNAVRTGARGPFGAALCARSRRRSRGGHRQRSQ